MACTRGCCPTPADHYRSLHVGGFAPKSQTKTDVHEAGGKVTHTVDVTESGDRQDVTVKMREPVALNAST